MISAKIIADSISPLGRRLTTLQLRYPRFVHAEFMTHRVFSRNASSSRAIPVKKMIEDIRLLPAMPIHWGSNKPGMQAGDELTGQELEDVKSLWWSAMDKAIHHAELLMDAGLHKQIANRILEPWAHINTLVTATEYENFFELRCHKDAQPEIRVLAECMRDIMHENKPVLLQPGEWHLPYVTERELEKFGLEVGLKLSVARCARVSYLTQEGNHPTVEADLALYDRLVGGVPLHASPAEHQATPDCQFETETHPYVRYECPEQHGNFVGWRQYRRTLEGGIV